LRRASGKRQRPFVARRITKTEALYDFYTFRTLTLRTDTETDRFRFHSAEP
jgi:hypothetical protein